MIFRRNLTVAAAALCLLAACSSNEETGERAVEEGGQAAGDVLGGTISDAMLPLEQLRSQSPRASGQDAAPIPPAEADPTERGASEESEAQTPFPTAPQPLPVAPPAAPPTPTPLPVAPPASEGAGPASAAPTPQVAPPLDDGGA